MKSIAVNCYGLTRQHYTGKEVYIHGLIRELSRGGTPHQITGIYPRGRGKIPEWIDAPGIQLTSTIALNSYTAWCQIILPGAVRNLHPDIMIYGESMLPFFSSGSKTRNLVVLYDIMYMHVRDEFDSKTRRILHALIPRTLRCADAIVTISQSSKDDLIKFYGAESAKIHIVYPGVSDAIHHQPDDLVALTRKELDIKGRIISYAGNHLRYKNLQTLLVAFQRLLVSMKQDPPTLVLIGKKEKHTAQLEDLISRLGLRAKVRVTGYVTPQQYQCLLTASEVLVLPSLYEGFGIPLIEAMAIGTPVAASNIGAMAEVVGDSGVLFDPRNPADIAGSLETMLASPGLLETYRTRGLERVKQFQWNRSAGVMSRVLDNLK